MRQNQSPLILTAIFGVIQFYQAICKYGQSFCKYPHSFVLKAVSAIVLLCTYKSPYSSVIEHRIIERPMNVVDIIIIPIIFIHHLLFRYV